MPKLVLTRREGEEIVIVDSGGEIARVRVAEARGVARGKLRLAVEAPLRFGVHRAEVWDRIRAEKAAHGGEIAGKAGAAA